MNSVVAGEAGGCSVFYMQAVVTLLAESNVTFASAASGQKHASHPIIFRFLGEIQGLI